MSRSRFAGQSVLVTGAGTGLGRAIALAFAAEGARVVVAGRTRATLDATVDLIEAAGGTAVAHTADVSRAGDLHELVRATVERFGSLDVAVNNAGVFRGAGLVAELAADDWQALLDINVTGVLLALQAEIAQMRTQEHGGAIVNISSNLGPHKSRAGVTGYAVSKAAVSALTRGAALDHIGDGVRVNAVSPGPSATAMSLRPGETEADRAVRMKEESPLGRVAAADEVAAAVLYLASEDAAAVVGADLVIDGGAAA
ncbi:SDR family NAD(P)-dependent oxidoreductase [Streptomyces longhuiensis]|uniref:SDR family NAD(P)-dependent oxidoreductase n=1 Tax=Streptomyces longhuiensis TaxID=2880933 RepID=UPI001D0B3A4C|nr:SDR family oxidoreductase [Streptomyces longhuiensis]UDL99742.1 SDR family oxidoreductase [Streptomyces longhuiensis]